MILLANKLCISYLYKSNVNMFHERRKLKLFSGNGNQLFADRVLRIHFLLRL